MTAALAGCVADVPPPIVPPPVYSAQPVPTPYYVAPAPQAYYYPSYPTYYGPSYYGPCCSSVYFGYSGGWHHGGWRRWHR